MNRKMKHSLLPLLLLFVAAAGLAARQGITILTDADQPWLATAPGIFEERGSTLILKPSGNMHWIAYNRNLALPLKISFRENIRPTSGSVTFLWNYNLYDAARKKQLSTGYNQVMEINRSSITYLENVFNRKRIATASNSERKWEITVTKNSSEIRLNGKLVVNSAGDDAIPAFAIQLHAAAGQQFQLHDFKIKSGSQTTPQKVTIYQYPLRDMSGRTLTIFAPPDLTDEQRRATGKFPALFKSVEEEAGLPVTHTDPIIAIYEKVMSGNNLAASPGYAGWLAVGPTMAEKLHLVAHEIAHFYFCIGASCGSGMDTSITDMKEAAMASVANNWMIEGFASYLGFRGLNRLENHDPNRYSEDFGNFFFKNDDIRLGGWYDSPLDDGSRIKAKHVPPGAKRLDVAFNLAYGKGYRFFYLLGSKLGHDVIKQIISHNRQRRTQNYTPARFLADLERFSGKQVRPYFAGWIFPGKYERNSPLDFVDKNQNGIIDFAE